jgi:hypothetical protein
VVKYTLNKYTFDNEAVVFESEDEQSVVEKALEMSAESDYYTYRLEKHVNNEMIGGWRFFNNGKEFTELIRKSVMVNYQ